MKGQFGSGSIVVVLVIAILATVGVGSTSVGMLLNAREQAMTAAEGAALAAAVSTYPPASDIGPLVAARAIAAANGSVVEGCICQVNPLLVARRASVITGLQIEVPIFGKVTVRGAATAEFDPLAWLDLLGQGGHIFI